MMPIRKWILRRVLKSALTFEREARGLYETLSRELGGTARGGLEHLIEEERLHHRLLEDIVAGRLDDAELERTLSGHRYHALAETPPLDEVARAAFGARLEAALRDEQAAVAFYDNLARIGKIPAVKLAFRVLAEMEREHVDILRALLGVGPSVSPGR
jgi:rubrerythrin